MSNRLLRELAETATPGPWDAFGGERLGDVLSDPDDDGARFVVCEHAGSDAPYIAACDPQTILALLDERDTLRAQRAMDDIRIEKVTDAARRAEAERDRLRAALRNIATFERETPSGWCPTPEADIAREALARDAA